MIKSHIAAITLAIATLMLCSCSKTSRQPVYVDLQPVEYIQLQGWRHDHHLRALHTLRNSCQAIQKRNPHRAIGHRTHLGGKVADWLPICNAANGDIFLSKQARAFFENWFIPYAVRDEQNKDTGKFTGYYEIEVPGSLKRSKLYKHPVYRRPVNLKALKGKLTHADINAGALAGKRLEIAWVADRARLFFMQIQGSGVIKLNTGGEIKVGYDGENGFSYTAIGPLFKEYTKDRITSAADMMRWLHRNPKIGRKIMERNKSYVFFRKISGPSPVGGQGIALTPERSIAIDFRLYPYGTPVWLQTATPNTPIHRSHPYHLLMIAQDTGGAIKGAIRGDIFYGRGPYAEEMACHMNRPGKYFMLFPKSVKVPRSYRSG